LDLDSLQTCDKDFLQGTTINGSLDLRSLQTCDKDFLQGTTINGYLDLRSLQTCDKDFLQGTTINGSLYLRSLQTCDKDFLQGTTINGYLYLDSLQTCDKDLIRHNVSQIQEGYNKDRNNCYFDNILSKVLSVSHKEGITFYKTPFGYIAQKGEFTSHGKDLHKAVEDLNFKIISEKLKKDPINADTKLTVMYYRTLTGACDLGCRDWMSKNGIDYTTINGKTVEISPITAKDLLPILEKTNAYGFEKFKSLITF
jgi:hypothetical protein